MEVAVILIVLAVTSSSVVGLLAIWAGLGRGHWFLRVVAVGAVLGLALLIPAYELVVVYTIQCLVVVPMLLVARRFRARGEGNHALQFTLLDLLLLTAVVAVLFAVWVSIPGKVWESDGLFGMVQMFCGAIATPPWVDYLLTGLIMAWVTLAATWLALGRQRQWVRWVVFLGYAMLLTAAAGVMAYWGWEGRKFDAMTAGIPGSALQWTASPCDVTLILFLPLIVMAAFLALSRVQAELQTTPSKKRRLAIALVLTLLGLTLLVPPTWTFYRFMTPPPIPNDPLPEPNGYDVVLRAGKKLENVSVPTSDKDVPEAERAAPKDYREFYNKYHAQVEDARKALEHECRVPLKYDISDLDGIIEMRQLARALIAQGDAALMDGDAAAASRYYRDTIRLGKASAHGGLAIHWLVGVAVESIGLHAVHAQCDSMTTSVRREWIAAIPALVNDSESLEECRERDAVWDQRACGWQGQFTWLIENHEASAGVDSAFVHAGSQLHARYQALLIDLALAEYRSKHGAYPKELAALVPEVLKELPVDPFSEKPLVYRLTDKGYVLYSVGPNGVDDGGKPDPVNPDPDNDDVGFW
jgi:hypothetical protein